MLIPPQRRENIKKLFWAVEGHHVKRNFSHLLKRSEKGSISCPFRLARGHVAETAPSKHPVLGLIVFLFCARRWDLRNFNDSAFMKEEKRIIFAASTSCPLILVAMDFNIISREQFLR